MTEQIFELVNVVPNDHRLLINLNTLADINSRLVHETQLRDQLGQYIR